MFTLYICTFISQIKWIKLQTVLSCTWVFYEKEWSLVEYFLTHLSAWASVCQVVWWAVLVVFETLYSLNLETKITINSNHLITNALLIAMKWFLLASWKTWKIKALIKLTLIESRKILSKSHLSQSGNKSLNLWVFSHYLGALKTWSMQLVLTQE